MQLLASRLQLADSEASRVCTRTQHGSAATHPGFALAVSSATTHELFAPWLDGYTEPAFPGALGATDAWDLGASWHPWAEAVEPLHALHLDVAWSAVPIEVRLPPRRSAQIVRRLSCGVPALARGMAK